MNARVSMGRETALLAYALLRQAERSLDHSLPDGWPDLCAYYSTKHGQRLRTFLNDHEEYSQFSTDAHVAASRKALRTRFFLPYHVPARYVRTLLFPNATSDAFRADEVRFIFAVLRQFINYLDGVGVPTEHARTQLRQDLQSAELIVEMRCVPSPRLAKARAVENLGMPATAQHFSVEEILGYTS